MNLDITINDYLKELSSTAPTPGGGNVAALSAVLASALGVMVCNLTIGKKKYAAVEEEFKILQVRLEHIQEEFTMLAYRDNAAFDEVMECYKLPKDTDEQKSLRTLKIDDATFYAAEVPYEVMEKCNELLPLLVTCIERGYVNSLSDAGVAVSLVNTAMQGAYFNVLINCSSLNDRSKGNELLIKATSLYNKLKKESQKINDEIIQRLSK